MSYKKYDSLIINDIPYDKEQLLILTQKNIIDPKIEPWLKEFWSFIQEWLNDSSIISVETSGSTGKPKTILLEKQKMVHSALATGKYFKLQTNQKALLCLPSHYIAGKMMIVRAFVLQLNLILVEPSSCPLKNINHTNIEFAAMVPFQVEESITHTPNEIKNIHQLIIGGAPIHPNLYLKLQYISIKFYATYGMTETITHVAVKLLNGMAKDSFFQALPNVTFSQDDRNCLIINAPHVLDDVIITNDIVQLFSDNQFRWIGRYDNVINSGGIKLHPEEIEKQLNSIIKIPFFVASAPHKTLGEQIILIIEKDHISKNKQIVLLAQMQEVLDKYEVPKKIKCITPFIKTKTGKIQRKETLNLLGKI